MVSKDTIFSKKTIPWRAIGNEVVIMDVAKGEIFQLNETAKEIWETVDGKRTIEEIGFHLTRSFEVGQEVALTDALRFVRKFQQQGWLNEETTG